MKRKILTCSFLFVFIIMGTISFGQNAIKIAGTVIDGDGQSIIGATIQLNDGRFGVASDEQGAFTMQLPSAGAYTLEVRYVGMETVIQNISVKKDMNDFIIRMAPSHDDLSQVVVAAKRENTVMEEQAMQIKSIDVAQVSSVSRDLSAAIDQQSGVRVRTSGSYGDAVDISLNGLNGTAVRLYIDGLPVEFLYPSLNIGTIPMHQVKRVDIYKGVLPIHVGTDAIGGGINMISSDPTTNSLRLSYGIGSFNTHQAEVGGTYKLNDHTYFTANGFYAKSDNDYEMNAYVWEAAEVQKIRRFHDHFSFAALDASITFLHKPWADRLKLTCTTGRFDKELQNGGRVGRLAYGEALYDGSNLNGVLDHSITVSEKLEIRNIVAFAHEQIIFRDTSSNVYSWSGKVVSQDNRGEFSSATNSDRDQNSFLHRINVGYPISENVRLNFSNLYANQLVTGRDHEKAIERDALQFDQRLIKTVTGLALSSDLLDERLELSAAIKNYQFKLKTVDYRAFSPVSVSNSRIGYYGTLKYSIKKNIFSRASYEKTLRIPTHGQFFGNGVNIIPNSSLKPEQSDNYNLGFTYKNDRRNRLNWQVDINGFVRNQSNIIFLTSDVRQQYINAEKVSTRGLELDFRLTFDQRFRLSANITRLRKKYEEIDQSNSSAQFLVGTDFPNTPDFFYGADVSYSIDNPWLSRSKIKPWVSYKYVDEFNFINVGQIRNPDNWVIAQQRLNAGVKLDFDQRKYTVSLTVNNILDNELFDNYRLPKPGRNYLLKLIYNFKNIN